MKLLFLTKQGGISGATYSQLYLTRTLASRGHSVFVGCPPDTLFFEKLQSTDVTAIPMAFDSKTDLVTMRRIRDLVLSEDIRIINAQSSTDRYVSILARWAYRLPVQVVHTRRVMPRSSGGVLQGAFYTLGTDAIVTVSDAIKQPLYKMGIPENHLTTIYNGTPREKYGVVTGDRIHQLRRKHDIQSGDVVIGCVSRMKQQDLILRALPLLDRAVKVLFVGIDAHPDLTRLIRQSPTEHRIHFCGTVDITDALNYYKLFTIMVLPSETEGLSQSILEAMALEVPVIASHAGGNPEIIMDGRNGLLFDNNRVEDLAAKLRRLINHPDLRDRIAREGRRTALERFSLENTTRNYEDFFADLLAGRRIRPKYHQDQF